MPRKPLSSSSRPKAVRRKAPVAALAAAAPPTPCFSVDTTDVPSLPDCYFSGAGSSTDAAVYTYDALGRLRSSISPPGQPVFFPPPPAQASPPKKTATKRRRSPKKKGR